MDADLQDPPETIPELLNKWRETGADVVHTVRRSRKGERRIKLMLTTFGYYILNRTTRLRLPMEAGDFKLLSRRAAGYIASLDEKKPFMRGMACWIGFRQEFVPYDREPRFAGKTKFHVFSFDVMNNFLESALISFSSAPLRLTSYLGFISILFSLVLIVHVAYEKLSGHAIPGWTAIMVAVIFLGSIQLFCIGLIGLYISTIYEEVKKRPTYIIASTYGFPDDEKKTQA
jgi:dolichol-phosphate mannosyltransferase